MCRMYDNILRLQDRTAVSRGTEIGLLSPFELAIPTPPDEVYKETICLHPRAP